MDDPPLLVTAHLDKAAFDRLDALRSRFFPPSLNKVPAHISLFHHLPGQEIRAVLEAVRAVCAAQAPFALVAGAPRFLGRGVALTYGSETLARIHADLATRFRGWLTAQDRQPFAAHVTIQNKVTAREARELFARIASLPSPTVEVEGLDVWRYRGGPWEAVARVAFSVPRPA